MKELLVNDVLNVNYYSVLMDGSTDFSVVEQELVYIIFLNKGVLKVKFFNIGNDQSANAEDLLLSLKDLFEHIGLT